MNFLETIIDEREKVQKLYISKLENKMNIENQEDNLEKVITLY